MSKANLENIAGLTGTVLTLAVLGMLACHIIDDMQYRVASPAVAYKKVLALNAKYAARAEYRNERDTVKFHIQYDAGTGMYTVNPDMENEPNPTYVKPR